MQNLRDIEKRKTTKEAALQAARAIELDEQGCAAAIAAWEECQDAEAKKRAEKESTNV